ncbi:recombinase family protein [Tautonia sp. JC769]|uniref:recombinase family protein n=1 Tax=Tautonia sp. JC769 TaxID=3232135 RepID=UPI0034595DBB
MRQDRQFVAYFRVDGVGLAEQVRCVEEHAQASGGVIARRFRDDESGGVEDRPELRKALAYARSRGCELIVATLWGLSRDVAFLRALHESGAEFLACDFPQANRRTIDVLTALAEYEARAASARTRAGLAAYKAGGGKLGAARTGGATLTVEARARGVDRASAARRVQADSAYREIGPMAAELRGAGFTLQQIADRLNEAGYLTRRGRPWNAMQVSRVLRRDLGSRGGV